MDQLSDLVEGITFEPTALLDIALTALLIYGLFSLIQGTRAVRLVIGAIVLYLIYVVAQALELRLLSGIMQTGAVVGLLALVVVFQPELRRALERLGRFGSLGWMTSAGAASAERVARIVARAAATMSASRTGALIVIERETGLEDTAESGVMLHADLSDELLRSLFTPRGALHDGAVILRAERILAAGAVLPLSDASGGRERMGTRHRAAVGITEQTDALAVVVSEETGRISLVEHGRVLRDLDEERLRARLVALLRPGDGAGRAAKGISALGRSTIGRGKRLRGRRGGRVLGEETAGPSGSPVASPPAGAAGAAGPAGVAEANGAEGAVAATGVAGAPPASTRAAE
ncbi:MAG: diadenylate cyclase CdaA [Chloroflexota bacterium]